MLTRYIVVLGIFVLSSCTLADMIPMQNNTDTGSIDQTGKTDTGSIYQTGSIDSGSQDHQDPLIENLTGSGDEYDPIFNGMETKTIHIKHTSGKATTIAFINSEAKSVEVSVTFPTASGGNLRWSQVVMPDGTMDGPFGQKIGYNLKQFGGYQFIFNENMMSGDPWSGEADITLTLRDIPYSTDVLILN